MNPKRSGWMWALVQSVTLLAVLVLALHDWLRHPFDG